MLHLRKGIRTCKKFESCIRMASNTASSSKPSCERNLSAIDTSAPTTHSLLPSSTHGPSASVSSGHLSLSSPIGYVKSCFKSKNGTPRQPSVCSYSRAKLQILKSTFVCPSHSLEGLAQFSHVWILFVFHQNSQESFTKAKVKPPRLDGKKVGVFASRSPHRPNPVGLTLARLDKVQGDTVYISGMDMIDGTPVLDIKPYVPEYDRPMQVSDTRDSRTCLDRREKPSEGGQMSDSVTESTEAEKCNLQVDGDSSIRSINPSSLASTDLSNETHCAGEANDQDQEKLKNADPVTVDRQPLVQSNSCRMVQFEQRDADANHVSDHSQSEWNSCVAGPPQGSLDLVDDSGNDVKVADWIGAPPIKKLAVRFTPSAEAQLAAFWPGQDHEHELEFLRDYEEAHQAIEDILSADPRSVYRRNSCSDRLYYFTIDNLHITSWFGPDLAEVLYIQPISSADIPKTSRGEPSSLNKKLKSKCKNAINKL